MKVPVSMDSPNEALLCARFLDDHGALDAELDAVAETLRRGHEATAAWKDFAAHLAAHMAAEERWLVPLLFRASPRVARTIAEEHKHLRARLVDVTAALDGGRKEPAIVLAFAAELNAHARNEEAVMYRWAEDNLDPAERLAIVAALGRST